MIGSHNSFTYLPASKWYFKPFTFIWRCQNKTIEEQKELGVTYLDVRIRRITYNTNGLIRYRYSLCHGVVDIGTSFDNVYSLFDYLESFDCLYRLIIERGDDWFIDKLNAEFYVKHYAKHCVYIGVKNPWTTIYIKENFSIKDYSYVPVYTGCKPKDFKFVFSTIKQWAKKHNPIINNDLIKDKVIHFMDYVGINNENKK